jgi:hypothetical protein
MALGDVIARLSVSLGLETTAFEKGSRRAIKETETLGKKMTRIAGVIGTAFVASIGVDTVRAWADATKGALDFAGSLGETAQQVGATTDELQEFRYVASQVGIEQATMDKGLAKISVTLGELQAGIGGTAKKLEEFGFSQAEIAKLSKLTAGEALSFLAGKYAALESPTEKAALAAAFFGSRMGGQFIPLLNEGAAGLQKMRDAAHELGIVISESAIQNADKNADLLSTYEQIATAQKNAALTVPENVRAYVEYEKTINNLQVAFYKAVGGLNQFNEWSKRVNQSLRDFGKDSGIQGFFTAFDARARAFGKTMHDTIASIVTSVGNMVTAVGRWFARLSPIITSVLNPIQAVQTAFRNLWDKVVGNSYIPDMVDGIAAHMARLDSVMVKPAEKATEATARKFRELRDLLDRLFPEAGKAGAFNADLSSIMGSALNDNEKTEATMRLWREFLSGSPFGSGGMGGPDFGSGGGPLVEGMGATEEAIERLTEKARIGSVRIADSFKDMADKTLASLSRLTSAIKGGGFLGILEAVIGVGLQLGSIGAFGKGIQTRLNSVPKYASGTNFHPGGLAMVGERGPELVSMPRGSRVTPNAELGGRQLVEIVDTTGLFRMRVNGQILEAAPAIAQAGAQGGVALGQYKQSRRWR